MDQKSDIERFKAGEKFSYPVIYLGRGPAEDTISSTIAFRPAEIPENILTKEMQIPGKLIFSLEGVDFKVTNQEDDLNELSILLEDIEGEEACDENKILSITTLSRDGCQGYEEGETFYFDASEDDGRAVYHPQWINIGKRCIEDKKEVYESSSDEDEGSP